MNKIFTVKEYAPSYQGLESFYVTYNLENKTITVNGKTKPMNKFWQEKAEKYIKNN